MNIFIYIYTNKRFKWVSLKYNIGMVNSYENSRRVLHIILSSTLMNAFCPTYFCVTNLSLISLVFSVTLTVVDKYLENIGRKFTLFVWFILESHAIISGYTTRLKVIYN